MITQIFFSSMCMCPLNFSLLRRLPLLLPFDAVASAFAVVNLFIICTQIHMHKPQKQQQNKQSIFFCSTASFFFAEKIDVLNCIILH